MAAKCTIASTREEARRRKQRSSHDSLGSGPAAASPTLIGRERELAMLLELLAEPPAVAILEGEAGVGKTRLVRELLAQPTLAARTALVGGCHPLREPFPFGPVVEALRGAAAALPEELSPVTGALRPLLPELSSRLPPLPEGLGDERGAERHRLFRAVPELLRALGPAVLVLEDLHWVDESTAELVSFLLADLPPELSLVLTFRREDLRSAAPLLGITSRLPRSTLGLHVSLPPLDADQVRKLVGAILRLDGVSEEFAAYVHERTLGLPLAVEEVLRLLEDRRDLVRAQGRWVRRELELLAVPTAVRDSILERLGRLPPDAQSVAEAAAVLAIPATQDELRQIAGLSQSRASRGLSEALAVSLLRELDGGFGFRHTLASQAVYESIPRPERRELHVRAAQALKARRGIVPLAQLAHHYRQGARPREWLRYAEAAADQALSLGDDETASKLLRDALAGDGASTTLRGRLAVKLGRAALGGLVHGEVVALLQRIVDEERLPAETRGEVRSYLGQLRLSAGEGAVGRGELLRAVPELEREPELQVRVMMLLAAPSTGDAHIDEHLDWLRRADEVAVRATDPKIAAELRRHRSWILRFTGDPRADAALAEVPTAAGSLEERRGLSRFYGSLAYATAALGHYREAESLLTEAAAALVDPNDIYTTSTHSSTRLAIDWATGQWDGLDLRARRLLETPTDSRVAFLEAELALGLLSLSRGELDAADEHLSTAARLALGAGWLPTYATAVGGYARLLLARDDPEAAAEKALDCLDSIMRRKGIWVWAADVAPVAVDSLLALGRDAEARELVEELAGGLEGRDAPLASAALQVCRGAMLEKAGRLEDAARAYADARSRWDALPRPSEAAVAAEAQGRCLLARGDRAGEGLLIEALAAFERLAASWDSARVRRTLRAHGVALPYPWSGGRRRYGTELSPREQEIVRLVAAGRSNREIAEELVLSLRTVEGHVARAMRKAGVRSRRALGGVSL